MGLLDGKVALVSGVGPGFGRTVARMLAEAGADVALGARRQANLLAAAAEVEQLGRRCAWLPTDITEPEACARLVNHARIELGGIDVLVNVAHAYGSNRPFRTTYGSRDPDDVWRRTMEVNYFGSLNMTHAVVPAMQERGEGRVVMINTMAVRRVRADEGPYAASKAALAAIVKTLALELGPLGIRVNSVHPGYIMGPVVEESFHRIAAARGCAFDDVYGEIAVETALRYLPDEREVAGSVLFLASDLARPITGHSLDVNCGHWV